jgi:hypothetical protein
MPHSPRRKPLTTQQAQAARKKWNVPSWEKPEEYEYIKSLKGDRLRWEFFRRHERYRKLSEKKPRPRAHFLLGDFIDPAMRGDELPENFLFADSLRRGGGLALIPPPMKSLLFRKGEADPLAPQGKIDAYYGAQLRDLQEDYYLVLAFDPLRPITDQIKRATENIKNAHNEIKHEIPEILPPRGGKRTIKLKDAVKLLRVLDADWEGVSDKDIGYKIYNCKDYDAAAATGNQHLKRALTYWRTL